MPHDVFDEGKPRESNEDLEGPVSERTLFRNPTTHKHESLRENLK